MNPTFNYRLVLAASIAVFFCATAFSQDKGARGKEKRIADDTYGIGGTKTTFTAHDIQIVLFKDANGNRRLLENSYTYGSGNNLLRATGDTYFDNQGKRNFFYLRSVNYNNTPVLELQEKFSGGVRTALSAWSLQNNSKIIYNYNFNTSRLEVGGSYPDYTFKAETKLFPKVNSGLIAPKFEYTLTGNEHYRAKTSNNEYVQGTETTEAYEDYDEYDGSYRVVDKKVYDKHGVLRHEWYREYYPDGCEYEEENYYDCHGVPQYEDYTWYDDEGYSYKGEYRYYKDGKISAAYRFYDGYTYGYEETFDPATGNAVPGWHPELNDPKDFEPDTSDCPDTYTYWDHHFYLGPSLIIEDASGNHFNTYGFELTYYHNLCYRGGLLGDVGINFGKDGDTKYTKFTGLVGGEYMPIKTATLRDDFSFDVRGMLGLTYLTSKYSYITTYKNSTTSFTGDVGLGFDYKFTDKLGLGLRLDYMPVFEKGNTASNFRISLGMDF